MPKKVPLMGRQSDDIKSCCSPNILCIDYSLFTHLLKCHLSNASHLTYFISFGLLSYALRSLLFQLCRWEAWGSGTLDALLKLTGLQNWNQGLYACSLQVLSPHKACGTLPSALLNVTVISGEHTAEPLKDTHPLSLSLKARPQIRVRKVRHWPQAQDFRECPKPQ